MSAGIFVVFSRSLIVASLVAWALLSGSASAQPLAEVVAQTLASNPDVAEARSLLQARQEEVERARAGFRPSVDLSAGYGYEYTDSPATRGGGIASEELARKEFGVNASQMLFDGWGTQSELERQQSRRDSAAARLRGVSELVARQASEAYLDLLRYRELAALSVNNLEVHLRIQDQIRLRSEAGVGRRADLEQVNSRVALARANLVAAQVNLTDAETTYLRVVGVLPKGEMVQPLIEGDGLPANLEEALVLARARNPLVDTADADVSAAMAQHRASKQFNYPRFDLEVGGNFNDDIDGRPGYSNDLAAMLRMRFNLYRGGADAARIRETAFNVNESKEVRNRTLRQLEESLRLAWAAFDATSAQVPLLQQQVMAALATRDAYAQQFNLGQRTLLDLLNSENEVLQGRQSVVNAEVDRLLAHFRILETLGILVKHLGLSDALAARD